MKKLGVLFLFTIGLLLSGCDLLNEDFIGDVIDGIDELDCSENPDNELCNLIPSSDIEEAIIYELIQLVLSDDFDLNLEDNCSLVIVPTDEELTKQCAMGEFMFFVDTVTGFYPTSISNEGDVYTVTGTTDVEREQLTITVEIVLYQDMYRIAAWSVVSEVLPEDIDFYDVTDMFEQYLEDYMNLDIYGEDLVWTYYRGTHETMFIEARLTEVPTLDSMELSHVVKKSETTFEVYYYVNRAEETIEVALLIEVFEDEEGLYFSMIEPVDWQEYVCDESVEDCSLYKLHEVKEMYIQYLADYINPDVFGETLIWDYYRAPIDNMFIEVRNSDLSLINSVEFSHIIKVSEDNFEVYYHVTTPDEVINVSLLIQVMKDDEGIYFRILDQVPWQDYVCDETIEYCPSLLDEVEALYQAYLRDYVELDVESDDFLWQYFRANPEPIFEDTRYDDLGDGLELEFARVIERTDGVFEAFHISSIYGEDTKVGISLYLLEDEEGYYFSFIGPVDWVCDEAVGDCEEPVQAFDIAVVETLYQTYLEDYMNNGIHADDIQWMYHRENSNINYTVERLGVVEVFNTIDLSHVYAVSNNTFDVYEILHSDFGDTYIGYLISVYEDEEGMYFTIEDTLDFVDPVCDPTIDDCVDDPISFETKEVTTMFENYIADFMNLEVTGENLVWDYNRAINQDMFVNMRLNDVPTIDSMEMSHIKKVSNTTFEAYYLVNGPEGTIYASILIEVFRDDEGLYFGINGPVPWEDYVCDQATEDCGLFKKEDVEALYTQYLKDYLDLEIYGDDFIWTYYRATNQSMFLEMRNEDAASLLGLPFSHLVKRTENTFEVYYYVVKEHEVKEASLLISVLEDSEGLYFQIIDQVPWQEDECTLSDEGCVPENKEIITTFFDEFTNSDISDEIIISRYFGGESVAFMGIRSNYTVNGSMLSISSILENPDGSFNLNLIDFNGSFDMEFFILVSIERQNQGFILTITDR